MKSDVIPSIVDKSILKSIIEVKETVATIANDKSRRIFTAADLWNIQKKLYWLQMQEDTIGCRYSTLL